jgi:hypothetical protein
VILVDSELNQKPVPFLHVSFLKGDKTSLDVKTGLDGIAAAIYEYLKAVPYNPGPGIEGAPYLQNTCD